MTATATHTPTRKRRILIWAAVLIALLAIPVAVKLFNGDSRADLSRDACHLFVKQHADTVAFSSETTTHPAANTFQTVGTLTTNTGDRRSYTCRVIDGGDQFLLTSLTGIN